MIRSVTGASSGLADLLEEFADRLEAGEAPDVEAFAAAHPEQAEQLRRVLPTMLVLADLGRSASAGGAAPPSAGGGSEPTPGVLGDFRIVREVGRGGMGVVYEAEQVSLGRRVALKVLPFAATMDPRHLQRFHNEARAAAGLHHTNIVPVYGVGCERGVHYYAMQFIDGRTLADVIAQPQGVPSADVPTTAETPAAASAPTVPPAAQATSAAPRDAAYFRQVAEWGVQAAEALDCAHQMGVVHRDVKPANLLVDAAGRLWVTDFGLAQVQSDTRLTMTGDLVGTLRYMSPEQALAKRVVIDHRTDIYSLGATLYELLTLQPAFTGSDRQELLRQIAFEEPRRLRRINKAVPAELEVIVLKATEKNPADRYATAKDLADDLRRWREDRPIKARRPSRTQRVRKWARRNPALLWAAIIAGLVILTASAVSTAAIWQKQTETQGALDDRDQALKRELLAGIGLRSALANEQESAYFLRISLADLGIGAGEAHRAEQRLDACPPALRRWEWHHLKRLCRGPLHLSTLAGALAFSSDGQRVTCVGEDHRISVWDVSRRTQVSVFDFRGGTGLGAFTGKPLISGDGRYVTTIENGWVRVWDVASGQELHAWWSKGASFAAYLTGEKRLAAFDVRDTLTLWDSAAEQVVPTSQPTDIGLPQFSPDGRFVTNLPPIKGTKKVWSVQSGVELLAFGEVQHSVFSSDSTRIAIQIGSVVQIWDIPSKQKIKQESGLGPPLALDATARRLAYNFGETVRVWDFAVKQEIKRFPIAGTTAAFSPDGRWLAVGSGDRGVAAIYDLNSAEAVISAKMGSPVRHVAPSPDGKHVASLSLHEGIVVVFDVTTGRYVFPLVLDEKVTENVNCVSYSPEGDYLICGDESGSVSVWDAVTGRRLASGDGHRGRIWSIAVSPDGKLFATGGEDRLVKLWDAKTCEELRTFSGHTSAVFDIGFRSDGQRLVSAAAGGMGTRGTSELIVWDVETGQALREVPSEIGLKRVAFHPDGQQVMAARFDGLVKLWDVETGEERRLGDPPVRGDALALTPDGQRLATLVGSTVRIWDIRTGQEVLTLRGPAVASADRLTFSRDGKLVAAGLAHGMVVVWDGSPGAAGASDPPR
jgi:WD40 repeat protein/serine/threonine protein kinase